MKMNEISTFQIDLHFNDISMTIMLIMSTFLVFDGLATFCATYSFRKRLYDYIYPISRTIRPEVESIMNMYYMVYKNDVLHRYDRPFNHVPNVYTN